VAGAEKSEVLDVAIVGGGVSGVYCGWRLKTEGKEAKKLRVAVFEESDRIGGRLLSAEPPGLPRMRAELGGMRILDTQKRVSRLVDKLDIALYPFPVDDPQNIALLRGVHLRLADFTTHPDRVPYRLGFQEHGKSAGQILIDAIERILPGITKLSPEERLEAVEAATFDGKPLYRQGFWQVLVRVISNEAYDLSLQAGGYNSTLTSWNAADAIPWFLADFGVDAKYFGFRKGIQSIPLALAKKFEKAGGTIERGRRLLSFDRTRGGKKGGGEGDLLTLRFADGSKVDARKLILAMPRRALELLEPKGPVLGRDNGAVRALIGSVTPRPLFKLFTVYEAPWWLSAGVERGRTVTDLPVRQTYYWPNGDGSPRTTGPAMLMATYDDGDNIGFWDAFRPRRSRVREVGGRRAIELASNLTVYRGPGDPCDDPKTASKLRDWCDHVAPAEMVAEIQRQLALIHGLPYVPAPTTAAFKDWGADPYGGGWNSWNIGVRSWEIEKEILQPVPDVPVYICGEAYSRAQGWVEGALDTADQVLAKLGVAPLVE